MASILLFREKFPREARKNDVAHPGLARFANFFSLDSHAKSAISHLVARGRHGSSARDALWRRARAWTFACPDSTFSFPFPPPRGSRVRTRRSLLFVLRYFRPSCDRFGEETERKRNGETEMETRRATDCSNRVYEVPVDRKARGHVARLRGREEREEGRRYLAVCDSNNEGNLEVHSADVLSWAKLMRFLFLQFRCFVLNLASLNVESNFFFLWQK